jgi:hypothetical protein
VNSHSTSTERRRSSRAFESLPLVVRGVDLLGQPFEERTTTLAFNSHGCRYSSTHHLPRNSWVTLELPASARTRDSEPLRARVAWVQRPHSIRDFFQIAVELETPADVWQPGPASESRNDFTYQSASARTATDASASDSPTEQVAGNFATQQPSAEAPDQSIADNPLVRELRAELQRQIQQTAQEAAQAAAEEAQHKVSRASEEHERKLSSTADETFTRWQAELDQRQNQARAEYSASLSAQQNEFLSTVKSEMDATIRQAHDLVGQLHHQTETLRSASEVAHEKSSQVAHSLLQLEAAETARASRPPAGTSREELDAQEGLAAGWRRRLESEMQVAQKQWNELLQSSLDSNLNHMVGQISAHSQEILQTAERKMTERLGELREPFAKAAEEARDTIAGIQSSLTHEVQRARGSLTEVEQVAARTKEISEQLEAASHDTLNQLHRRLEKILDTHTAEMNRRAEGISTNLSQTAGASLDSIGHQFLQRTTAETEGALAPHLEKVPALLRELESREVQTEETLRVHRERLRQLAEGSQREVDGQISSATANLHANFEAARRDALAKWSEELDASGVRAAHSAAEALGRTSEWFQQEARARLQVQVEQAMVTAGVDLTGRIGTAAQSFDNQITAQSGSHLAQIRDQVEGIAHEHSGRARSEMERAAEAAAASFGQVLHAESERQTVEFRSATAGIQRERVGEFEHATQEMLHKLEVNAWSSMESFRVRMAEQLESAVIEGRGMLQTEFTSALGNYQAERETHRQQWAEHLERLSGEASGRYQEKLQMAGDTWIASSVRRLNEHGQNGIESLLKSADQSLRDSFAKVFEGLSEMLRDRSANAAGIGTAAGFGQLPNRENSESSTRNNVI